MSLLLFLGVCRPAIVQANEKKPRRDINAVLHDHEKALLALPDVVGVYVGLLDGPGTEQCLRLMLAKLSPATRQMLPKSIEGYLVVPEVTGEIRPLEPTRRSGR